MVLMVSAETHRLMTEPLPAPPPDEQPEDPDNDDAGDEPVEGD